MDLPSSREIELETFLRQRDAQVQDLTDEVTHLRQYLANQPSPSTTDPVSLPPALVSLLLPHIKDGSSIATGSSSNTVAAALTQRVKVLQEENDELYELLKTGETGKLMEDVRSLRRVVQKLEGALRESHQVISNLSEELDKAHATILANNRSNHNNSPRTHSQSPVLRPSNQLPSYSNSSNGSAKPVPTGPRAHKKPRLSEAPTSVPPHMKGNRSQSSHRRNDSRERSPRGPNDRKPTPRAKMEVDDDPRNRPRTPDRARDGDRDRERERDADYDRDRDRDRDRERERDREPDRDRMKGRERDRERDRPRDRDRDRQPKRNGAYGGPSGGGGGGGAIRRGHRSSNANSYAGGDRTLAERMGL